MDFFFVDKILPFLKKKSSIEQLERLNLFQFYIQRYGLGSSISKKINNISGIHFSYKVNNCLPNVINQNLKFIFTRNIESMDLFLEQKMLLKIKEDINLYTYRGDRYQLRLPLHGQRRRANNKTVKKVRQYIL